MHKLPGGGRVVTSLVRGRSGDEMKKRETAILLAVLACSGAFASSAHASISACRSIPDPARRLACYDKAADAAAPGVKPAAVQPARDWLFDTPASRDAMAAAPVRAVTPQEHGPRFWFEADAGAYRFSRIVPLAMPNVPVTTGPTPVPTSPGFIGLVSMSTVTNPVGTPAGWGGGGSYRMGYWLDPAQTSSVEAGAFFALGVSRFVPTPTTLTTSTSINTTPDVFVVLFDDTTTATATNGAIWDLLYGADANYRVAVPHFLNLTNFDVMVGMRYVGLDEFAGFSSSVFTRSYRQPLGLPAPFNQPIEFSSAGPGYYRVWNNFIGPQIGFNAEQRWGRFWVETENTVAAGPTLEVVTSGATLSSTTSTTGIALAGIPLVVSTGATSTGHSGDVVHVKGTFTIVPSGTLKFGYDLIPNERSLTLAYNYLYMSNVGLIGDEFPSAIGTKQSGFFAQGITLGLKQKF